MRKQSIYITLFTALTACTENELQLTLPVEAPAGTITASITATGISSRMIDADIEDDTGISLGSQTKFQTDDPILLGWSGSSTYQYIYSGENGIFNPATGTDNYNLWKDLAASTSNPTDVYAWYGQTENSFPAIGATVAVQSDQKLESGYLKSLRLAAHTSVNPYTCKTLQLDFKHLMACFRIHLTIDDREVTSTDIMGSSAILIDVNMSGSLQANSKEYELTTTTGTKGDIQMYRCPWSEKNPFLIDFKCLLPPQTLPTSQKITVTLANGKKYNCTLQSEVVLEAGKVTYLPVTIEAKEGLSVFTPVCTTMDASQSAFSGNRIISAIKQNDGSMRFRVYDKRPDGTWGDGEPVYEDENGITEFPTSNQYTKLSYINNTPNISLYGDYAVLGYPDMSSSAARTFFIKKSRNTRRWYCSDGPIGFCGYAVTISQNFLITGNHVNTGQGRNTYVYPIDENGDIHPYNTTTGELDTKYIVYGMSGYKLALAGNILASNNGVFQYNESNRSWEQLYGAKYGNQRVATDGKRVIIQTGGGDADIHIYDLAGNEEGWSTARPKAGVDRPIGIYGDYALAGTANEVNICYRNPNNSNKWEIINPDGNFLEMMKHWDKTITATSLNGSHLTLKGTRALIVSDDKAYFIENIDKMVADWLANPY